MRAEAIHHVQVVIPPGREAAAWGFHPARKAQVAFLARDPGAWRQRVAASRASVHEPLPGYHRFYAEAGWSCWSRRPDRLAKPVSLVIGTFPI
ncbi:MAG: hypothetical protein C4328_11950 [Meiothermus sp.]